MADLTAAELDQMIALDEQTPPDQPLDLSQVKRLQAEPLNANLSASELDKMIALDEATPPDQPLDLSKVNERGVFGKISDAIGAGVDWAKEKGKDAALYYQASKDELEQAKIEGLDRPEYFDNPHFRDHALPMVGDRIQADLGISPGWAGHAVGKAFDVLDRVSGTVIGNAVDSIFDTNIMHDPTLDQSLTFPVSFSRELVQRPTEKYVAKGGQALQKSESQTARELGEVVEGLAPASGIVAGVVAPAILDPMYWLQFGTLTKLGKSLEAAAPIESQVLKTILEGAPKAVTPLAEGETTGRLAKNLVEQFEKGQRAAVSIKPPFLPKIDLPANAVTNKMIDLGQQALIAAEMTKFGQQARMFTTFSGLKPVDDAALSHSVTMRAIDQQSQRFVEDVYTKAAHLGVDLRDPKIREDLWKYFETPSRYKGSIPEEKAQVLFEMMDAHRREAWDTAKRANLKTPEFQTWLEEAEAKKADVLFKLESQKVRFPDQADRLDQLAQQEIYRIDEEASKGWGKMSERYVPRGASLENRQMKKAQDMVNSQAEAEEILATAGAFPGGRKTGAHLMERAKFTKDEMNRVLKENNGIDGFFHDDIVASYAEKYRSVMKDVADKEFASQVYGSVGRDQGQWVEIINNAKKAVAEGSTDPNMLRLSKLRLSDVKSMNDSAQNRLRSFSNLTHDIPDAERMMLPGPAKDLMENMIARPDVGAVDSFMRQYMRAWKNNAFFSTGFHLRNTFENTGRAVAVGNTPLDVAKSAATVIMGRDGLVPELNMTRKALFDEYSSMSKGIGLTHFDDAMRENNPMLAVSKKAGQMAEDILVEKGALTRDNAMKRLWGSIKNGAINQKTGEIFQKMKATINPFSKDIGYLADNPFYRFSSKAGENSENVFRFAYYEKLRKEGYNPVSAANKVGSIFMNYEMTREGMKSLQQYVPFANYMVKNAETTMRILAMKPSAALTFGPGGAIERAIHNWNEWDQDGVDQIRNMLGGSYHSDAILGPILSGKDAVFKKKDLLRDVINKIMNSDGKGTGYQTWAKLPSNFHALLQMNPANLNKMSGPLVKMAIALLGVDPFTGKPMQYSGTNQSLWENLSKAAEIATEPVQFRRLQQGLPQALDSLFPEYMKNYENLGLPVGALKLDPNMTLKNDKRSKEALMKLKTLGMGGATKLDLDFFFRSTAMLAAARDELTKGKGQAGREQDSEHYSRALINLKRTYGQIREMRETIDDFNERRVRLGGAPDQNIIETEDNPQPFVPPEPVPETVDEYNEEWGRRQIDMEKQDIEDLMNNREPQGKLEQKRIAANSTFVPEDLPNIGPALSGKEKDKYEAIRIKNEEAFNNIEEFYMGKKGPYYVYDTKTGKQKKQVVALHPHFLPKVWEIARELRVAPEVLLASMAFETGGTFNPGLGTGRMKNPGSKQPKNTAVGLIQFNHATQKGLGRHEKDMHELTQMEQLDYVRDYLKPLLKGKKAVSQSDLYAAILSPGVKRKNVLGPDSTILFEEGSREYKANKPLDLNRDGKVTKGEAAHKLDQWMPPVSAPRRNPSSEFRNPELAQTMDNAVARSPVKFSIDERGKVHAVDAAPHESGQKGLINMVGGIVRSAMPFYQRYADEELKKWGNTPKGRRKVEELLHYELNQSEELYKKPENPQGDLFKL